MHGDRHFLVAVLCCLLAFTGILPTASFARAASEASDKYGQLTELPVPDKADMLAGQRPYRIGPFDRLAIDVFGVPDLAVREVQADASGRISFPLVGVVEVLGLTPGEVEQLLRSRLQAKFIRDPQVTVNLKETVSQVVTVYGEVKTPGQYPVLGRLTLMTAIAKAGGTSEFSRKSNVLVYRTVKGQRLAALFDIKAIKQGKYDDPELYPNDLVIVDESMARRVFRDVIGATPLLFPLIVLLSQ